MATFDSRSRLFATDNGPTWSPLDHFLRTFQRLTDEHTPREIIAILFPFLEKYRPHADRLQQLKKIFGSLSAPEQDAMRQRSVVSFIFTSNTIENCGTSTERETKAIVCGLISDDAGQKDVLSTLAVLEGTYSPNPNSMRGTSFGIDNLKLWHKMLTSHDSSCNPGTLRMAGACTYRKEGQKVLYKYPSHLYVQQTLRPFCSVLAHLRVLCCDADNESDALIWVAMAAFAQFHFVTLHPFKDGNGRMCRILAKTILDCWMPVAIPMFPNKDDYFAALIEGQSMVDNNPYADELYCIEPLFKLLLITAESHLERVIRNRIAIYVCFEVKSTVAVTEHVLAEVVNHIKPKELTDAILTEAEPKVRLTLEHLEEFSSDTFDLGDVKIILHWSPAVQTPTQVAGKHTSLDEEIVRTDSQALISVTYEDDFR